MAVRLVEGTSSAQVDGIYGTDRKVMWPKAERAFNGLYGPSKWTLLYSAFTAQSIAPDGTVLKWHGTYTAKKN